MGLGAQDDLAGASDFFRQFGPFSFPMYWDATFQSWNQLGLASQPASALFTADGKVIGAWFGRIPEDKVLALIA